MRGAVGNACRAHSRLKVPWRDGDRFALAQPSDRVQHFVVVRPKVQMVGKEVVPEIVPMTAYTLPQTTTASQRGKENPLISL